MVNDDASTVSGLGLYLEVDADFYLDFNFEPVPMNLGEVEVVGVIDANDPEGLMPAGSHLKDLEVKVPLWPVPAPPGFNDQLVLYFKTGPGDYEVRSMSFPGPLNPGDFPYPLFIEKSALPTDGRCEVRYVVKSFNGYFSGSNIRNVTFDSLPPSFDKQLQPLLLPDDLADGRVTEEYLADHGDHVELRVPQPLYLDAREGDVISLYWSQDNPPTSGPIDTKTVTAPEIVSGEIRLTLSGDAIRSSGKDGTFYLTYKVRDRAGNETPFSLQTAVDVQLVPIPELPDLPEPEFPDATIYGYINCANEPWNGIRVRLPFPPGEVAVGDEILLSWQGYETLNGITPIEGTEGEFPGTVSAADLSAGSKDMMIEPYVPHIEPILEGSAIARYQLKKSNGQSALSYEGLVKITRKLAAGGTCEPPRAI
ncbi:hypothetical protein [Pseudomonas sp. LP_7_YM]|uniref:hypothetical protein n=1 Tax=Pseudomonas sp. LP_7_YM TaxID=2485137 RepID=UPI00105C7454|nr:hypothetical protein [Pseudomonas sp. LP_7_YM]TDV60052.1 hypothetical protein EC915_11315 [Pseudomonas sp. LP_7_YM]